MELRFHLRLAFFHEADDTKNLVIVVRGPDGFHKRGKNVLPETEYFNLERPFGVVEAELLDDGFAVIFRFNHPAYPYTLHGGR